MTKPTVQVPQFWVVDAERPLGQPPRRVVLSTAQFVLLDIGTRTLSLTHGNALTLTEESLKGVLEILGVETETSDDVVSKKPEPPSTLEIPVKKS